MLDEPCGQTCGHGVRIKYLPGEQEVPVCSYWRAVHTGGVQLQSRLYTLETDYLGYMFEHGDLLLVPYGAG